MEVQEEKARGKGEERLFEEIMVKNVDI